MIAVIIQHPADDPLSTSVWQSVLLGTLWTSGRDKLKKSRDARQKRLNLEKMNPGELAETHPRNVVVAYSDIESAELRTRFFQHQLRFYLSAPTKTGRIVGFNLDKKQLPEARRLLKAAGLV
ncbi:MAG: hypothetical protein PVJ61_04145 [Dehalococcoidia bacterium]